MLPGFWLRSSSRRKRIITVIVFLLLWQIATVAGVLTPLSRQDADSINQEFEQISKNINTEYIFGHNLILCLVMFVPIAGPAFGLFSSYSTGVVIVAQSMSPEAHGIPPLFLFSAYLLLPIYWFENIAMSIGLAESVWLIRRSMQGFGKREARNAAVLIAIVTIILLASAFLEIALIMALGG